MGFKGAADFFYFGEFRHGNLTTEETEIRGTPEEPASIFRQNRRRVVWWRREFDPGGICGRGEPGGSDRG